MNYHTKKRLQIALRRFYTSHSPSKEIAELIGIDREGFRTYVHNCVQSGMTPDTYGVTWGLDHIVPAELFSDDELHLCYNYNNLMPMFNDDNRMKGASVHFSLAKLESMYTNVFIQQLIHRCKKEIQNRYMKYLI